jgi:predicted transcriptional regulator
MADGDLKLKLDVELAKRLKSAADAGGLSVEVFAAILIGQGLDEGLAEGGARYTERQRTGEYPEAEPAMGAFCEAVAARFKPDGGLTVEIVGDLAEDVRRWAAAKGVPVEMFVRDALASHAFAEMEWSDDPDPSIDDRIADEAIRTGNTIPFEAVRPWLESWGKPDELPPPKWPGSS